jgi:hypothetical protein
VQRRDVVLQNKNRFFFLPPNKKKQSKQNEEEEEGINVGTTLFDGQLANISSYFTSSKTANKQDLQRK